MTNNHEALIHSLSWSGMTHNGRFRKNNEDAFLALTFDSKRVEYLGKEGEAGFDTGNFIFAVSDGMGGANAGEFASNIATQMITKLLPSTYTVGKTGLIDYGKEYLLEIFNAINKEMRQMSFSYEECRGMGATLSLCWLTPEITYFAHVGDSRIYHLPASGGIKQISHDHTHAGWLFRKGEIDEKAVRRHPNRSQLQQVLGGKQSTVEPQFGEMTIESGDHLVLCSDGIWDDVSDRNIEFKIKTPAPADQNTEPAKRLIDEALFNSGQDNLTALVIKIT